MATIINNPGEGNGSSMGTIVGLIILALVVIVFFVYGLPALRGNGSGTSNTTVEVPDKVQVDVNQ